MNYNIGIIGLGAIAHAYANSLTVIDNATLYAVGSRSTLKAQKFKEQYNAKKAYGSYKELLKDENVDLVYIATPMSTHYDIMMSAIEHGKHILCEKAFTLSADEAKRVLKQAKLNNIFVMEAMWSRLNPTLLEVKELVNNGEIGDVVSIDAEFCFNVEFNKDSRLFNKELGGGALLDIGIYPITFTDMFVGLDYLKIKSDAELASTGVDINNHIELKYKNILANLTSGFDKPGLNFAYIYGTKGYIKINEFWQAQYAEVIKNNKVTKIINKPFLKNGYEYETMHVLECLNNGLIMSPIISHDKTIEIMEFMDSLREEWGVIY